MRRPSPQLLVDELIRAWVAYIDNGGDAEGVWQEEAAAMIGVISDRQLAFRKALDAWGIPWSHVKSVVRQVQFKSLGDRVDGAAGIVDAPQEFNLRLISLSVATLQREYVSRHWMQKVWGRWVRNMQYGRSTSVTVHEGWRWITTGPASGPLPWAVIDELLLCLCQMAWMRVDMRQQVSPQVTVSDASEQGAGGCVSMGMTEAGEQALARSLAQQLLPSSGSP